MPKTTKHLKQHQFKPGQSGNPLGGKIHNPIKKALKNLTVKSYRRIIKAVCTGNLDNLEDIVKDPRSSALQVGIARALANAIKAGDYETIDKIAERIVGKIPDEVNVNSKNLNFNANGEIDKTKMKAALARFKSNI